MGRAPAAAAAAVLAATVALAIALPGCPRRAAGPPDLVLVVLPGLRADPTGVAGAEAAFLEGLGRQPGRRYRAAYAQSTAPFISLGSLLTGRYPSSIPLCGHVGAALPPPLLQLGRAAQADGAPSADAGDRGDTLGHDWCARIPDDRHTVEELLRLYGYHTGVATPDLPALRHLLGGRFDETHWIERDVQTRDTDWRGLESSAAAMLGVESPAPRFAMLVLPDLHPAELSSRLRARGCEGLDAARDHREARARDDHSPHAGCWQTTYQTFAREAGAGLGALMSAVEQAAPQRERWWIVTSSNGISLGEMTGTGGGAPGYGRLRNLATEIVVDRTIHVPLLVFPPDARDAEPPVDAPVELVDLLPTLVTLGRGEVPIGLPGDDLLAAHADGGPTPLAYAEFGDQLAIREGSDLLVMRCFLARGSSLDPWLTTCLQRRLAEARFVPNAEFGAEGQGSFFLHDLDADPRQLDNRFDADPDRTRALAEQMLSIRTGAGAPPDGALDPRQLEALRSCPAATYW